MHLWLAYRLRIARLGGRRDRTVRRWRQANRLSVANRRAWFLDGRHAWRLNCRRPW
jgi:hypothetical protein